MTSTAPSTKRLESSTPSETAIRGPTTELLLSQADQGGPGMTRARFIAGLLGALIAGTAPNRGAAAMPSQTKPRFDIPPGACDCHVHIFDPEHFPYSPGRSYTPGTASVDDLLAF